MGGADPQGALRLAEWEALAKLTGKPLGVICCEAMRAMIDADRQARGLRGIADECWDRISLQTRRVLLMLATDREDSAADARRRWQSFTPDEQIAIGALARALKRDLGDVERLR